MKHLLFVPLFLLGCVTDDEEDSRSAFAPRYATAWKTTPGGILRDAGPFGSVEAGYTSDSEIDAALDLARADFVARFPEYSWVNPAVHLTDDYAFWVSQAESWAAGMTAGDGIALALWSRIETADEPGSAWIKRPPGDYWGTVYAGWRYTGFGLVPAYQHECLHIAIGDPMHRSPLWGRL